MEREELRTTLVNHLETLRRNLQVVSMEVLKTKYKKPFDALRQDICKAATAYTHFLVFDGMRIKHKYFDEAVPYIDTAVKQTKRLKQISDAAFHRQDIDEIESLALALRKEIEAALQPFYMRHMCLYVTPECFDDPPKTPEVCNRLRLAGWYMAASGGYQRRVPTLCSIQIQGGSCRMKNTSQQYLNSEAHGYLMEAKACKLLLKDLERIRAKLKRHIEKEAADREAEFEAAMQYHSESDIQEAYGWEFISEQQYERYLELFRQGRKALDEHSPTVTELALSILNRIFQDIDRDCSQCEFEALSPEEQLAELKCAEESRQAWKQYIASLKEMVGSMTGKTNDHTASKNVATIHKEDAK